MLTLPKTITIKLDEWASFGNPYNPATKDANHDEYDPYLLDGEGSKCCLGFACEQSGVPVDLLRFACMPQDVAGSDGSGHPVKELLEMDGMLTSSELAATAAMINDANRRFGGFNSYTFEERMGLLFAWFQEHGIELQFV